jgi:nucleoside phosphorylase/CheY-like chemotaxis protein
MKILLVEDDRDKLRRVVDVLTNQCGCPLADISIAGDALSAKAQLRERSFDLMILDVALPERPDKEPDQRGGITLLEEITKRDLYHQPREIIGLSGYPEIVISAAPRFAEDVWMLLEYDPTSEAWAQQLRRKLHHIALAHRSGEPRAYATDLCVMTALYEPEFSSLLDIPWNWSEAEVPGDGTMFYKGTYMSAGQPRNVMAACAATMGIAASAVLATRMIHYFAPRYLAGVGILAGIRGRVELGDIIVADLCWEYGSGKRYVKDGASSFAAAPLHLPLNSFLRGKFASMTQDRAALHAIRDSWKAPKPTSDLSLHLGPVASGSAVIADASQLDVALQQHRKLIGIDMEAYGVMLAAHEAPLPEVKGFVIKSVCDFADDSKDDSVQHYAAFTSARALQAFVEHWL